MDIRFAHMALIDATGRGLTLPPGDVTMTATPAPPKPPKPPKPLPARVAAAQAKRARKARSLRLPMAQTP
jgi:hypothetical protein